MSLLDKFSTVEIKADKRISKDDKLFCEAHQKAFDQSFPALQRLEDALTAAVNEQREILPEDPGYFANTYMSIDGFNCGESGIRDIHDAMKKRNETFIKNLVRYFQRKYHVELNEQEIVKNLLPSEPDEPRMTMRRYQDMTEAEQSAFESEVQSYKGKKLDYENRLQNFPLRYEQIVDEIFVQLGGFSFEERSMNEFLERTWNCCHSRWDSDHPESFEIKNDILRLPHGCYCDENKWMSHPESEYKPSDDMKILLDALVYYECGRMNEGHVWFPDLYCYSGTKQNIHETYNMGKVKSIRFFKNGRVDIRFREAMYVQEFAEQYLRRKSL